MPACGSGVETHWDDRGIQLAVSKSPEGAHAVIDELRQVASTKATLNESLTGSLGASLKVLLASSLTWSVERALGLPLLKRLYLDTSRRPEPLFADRALAVLNIQTNVVGELDTIPSTGPLIVVANHPTGALDGLVMLSLLARRRGDVRILANHLLASIPDMRDDLILVDPFGGTDAVSRNRRPLREAMRWIRNGHCLCLFPAGVVSHLHREAGARAWRVADSAWHHSLGRLVQATGAPIVPCFIEGTNSAIFQLAGLVHPRLRTLLLPRELLNKRGTRVLVHVGRPVRHASTPGSEADALTAGLRVHADSLREGRPTQDAGACAVVAPRAIVGESSAEDWSVEAKEIAPLLEKQQLVRAGSFSVFWAEASQAPRLLDRIAVERELAFRAVGEGTGRDRDRDLFDDRYLHLCAWDHARHALVGAYRLGLLDAPASTSTSASIPGSNSSPKSDRGRHAGVVPALDMLYTSTLFQFDRRLDDLLSPAIELGRAFVRAPYQKQHAALMALWMGIGRLVLTRPHTRYLFGAASIPATYSVAARALMVAFLRRHALHRQFARLATPRNPIPAITFGSWTSRVSGPTHPLELSGEAIRAAAMQVPTTFDVDALDTKVRGLDREGKGVPVLLRHYLRLGARALAFNVDKNFNNALDVLVIVDLPNAPAALLRRYMGSDDVRAYVALHADGCGRDRAA
jgi:putative hemolysin